MPLGRNAWLDPEEADGSDEEEARPELLSFETGSQHHASGAGHCYRHLAVEQGRNDDADQARLQEQVADLNQQVVEQQDFSLHLEKQVVDLTQQVVEQQDVEQSLRAELSAVQATQTAKNEAIELERRSSANELRSLSASLQEVATQHAAELKEQNDALLESERGQNGLAEQLELARTSLRQSQQVEQDDASAAAREWDTLFRNELAECKEKNDALKSDLKDKAAHIEELQVQAERDLQGQKLLDQEIDEQAEEILQLEGTMQEQLRLHRKQAQQDLAECEERCNRKVETAQSHVTLIEKDKAALEQKLEAAQSHVTLMEKDKAALEQEIMQLRASLDSATTDNTDRPLVQTERHAGGCKRLVRWAVGCKTPAVDHE